MSTSLATVCNVVYIVGMNASSIETTIFHERATRRETTRHHERAKMVETTKVGERAMR